MKTIICKANSDKHFESIANLAIEIWEEHYTPIIGSAQVEYMLDKFQSTHAIKSQIDEGYEYFVIQHNKADVGYISVKQEESALFLSKVYVKSQLRGKGIGKEAMAFVEDHCRECRLPKVRLTVNKYNLNSKKAYEKMGFENMGSVVIDIGQGYIMDDFAMEKMII